MKLKKYDMTELSDQIDGQSLLDFPGRAGARIRIVNNVSLNRTVMIVGEGFGRWPVESWGT